MNEWKEYKLGDVVILNYGKALKTENRILGNIPVYSSAGISGVHNNYLIDSEGIIVGRKGTIGTVYYSKTPFWCIDTAYYILPNNDKYNMYFLYYLLKQLHLEELNEDSAVPGLNRETTYSQKVLLPTIIEQERIAGILSSLDDKIDLLGRQNTTLEAMAETFFLKWFSGKDYNSTIEQLIYIQNGYAFKSQDFKEIGTNGVVKIKNISGGIINIATTDYIDNQIASTIHPKFKISSGDILIAMTGAEIGKLGIIPSTDKDLWLNQRVGLLAEKYKGAKYLAYLQLKSDFGQDYIENTATGSAQPNISGNGIEKCGFPKLRELDIIKHSNKIGELYDKVIFNLGQINILTQVRNTLLPKLMNGEITVNGQVKN